MNDAHECREVLEIRNSYERIAANFNRVRAKPWKECVDFIQGFNPRSLVLDVGCGSGRHTLASVSRGHETIGIDFSENMLKTANVKFRSTKALPRVFHLVLAEASHMPFRNNTFDYILYIATLHNLPSRSLRIGSLREINRILKTKGKCLISVWKRLQFRFLLKVITIYLRKILGMKQDFEVQVPWKVDSSTVPRYFYLYSEKQIVEDIKAAELNILNFSSVKIGAQLMSDNYFVTVTKY